MINQSIFKSYDIRGIYPKELNEEAAYLIGRSFVKYTSAKKVVLGFDARISSPVLHEALAKGITVAGAKVYSIGQAPTECLYFAAASYDFDAGIMITASHNPKEYNGFKMMKKEANNIIWIRGKDLLSSIGSDSLKKYVDANVAARDILQDYINYVFSFIDVKKIKPFKIVIDTSNGVMGNVIGKIENRLPVKITDLNFTPDGNFPNHSPNPLELESSNQIEQEIMKQKANFGFMFDGDGDRLFLIDENGKLVNSDVSRLLLARYFLNKNPGAVIVYDAICSRAVPEFIKQWKGKPVKSQVGFVNIREALMKNNGIIGGEVSGHFCFKDYFYMDSGIMAFLTLLEIISQNQKSISEISKELLPYFKASDINFSIEDKNDAIKKIKEKYSDSKQDFLDGVTVEYQDWWFNVRPSNTEPLLRLTIEANTEELLEQKKKEVSNFIDSNF